MTNRPASLREPRRTRYVARGLVLLLAATLALGGTISWWVAGRLVAPAQRPVGTPPGDLPCEAVAISSDSGSRLAGWHLAAEDEQGVIVLLHGIRGSRLNMLDRARLFWQAGYSVLMVDFQAHGESPGEAITVGYLESFDARAAVEYARARHPGQAIGVVGVSMGAAAAVLASPLHVDALIVESVYPTIDEAVGNRVRMRLGPLGPLASAVLLIQLEPRLGVPRSQLRPIDKMDQLGCPLLVMAGSQDQHTTLPETRQLFERAVAPKELSVIEGAAHENLYRFAPQEYERRTLAFLETHVRGSPQR